MAVEVVYGGPVTSGVDFRSGFVEPRTAPILVSPKVIGTPLEFALLRQRRRAADPISGPVAPLTSVVINRDTEVIPFRGGQRQGELILATNPTLDALLDQIHQIRPNWGYLREKLTERHTHMVPHRLQGSLAELHVNTMLQTLAGYKRWRNLLNLVDLHDRETDNYRFSTSNGSLRAISKKTRQDVAEYDAFFEVDGLPTVIEVKAQGIQSIEEVDAAIGDEHIRKLFAPLQELYGPHTYFGYALVTVPEQNVTSTPVRRVFQEEGGLVTTMNTTLIDLKTQSLKTVYDLRRTA